MADEKKFPDLDALSPEDRAQLEQFERQLKQWQERTLANAPDHIRALGPILRKSVETGLVNGLWRFCLKHGIDVPRRQLALFRDYLITQRFDLKDLEPAARARVRLHVLRSEDKANMTRDYRLGQLAGVKMTCMECRYFVTAPDDGDPNDPDSTKSCVDLGTKGADAACFGFTRPPN